MEALRESVLTFIVGQLGWTLKRVWVDLVTSTWEVGAEKLLQVQGEEMAQLMSIRT